MPSTITFLRPGADNSMKLMRSPSLPRVDSISARAVAAYVSLPSLRSTAPAASVRPFFASHRGLSGTMNMPMKKSIAGAAVMANIHRQPCRPNHELAMY
jgi:hypothetical protein